MSRKKKLLFLTATTFSLIVLGGMGTVLYLQSNPEGRFAGFLQEHGVPVEAILEQPQVLAVSEKLDEFIPGVQIQAREPGQPPPTPTPAVFDGITIKGVIGAASESEALVNVAGETHWVRVGGKIPVKVPKGIVTLRCEEIRADAVVLRAINSDLRKEFALR